MAENYEPSANNGTAGLYPHGKGVGHVTEEFKANYVPANDGRGADFKRAFGAQLNNTGGDPISLELNQPKAPHPDRSGERRGPGSISARGDYEGHADYNRRPSGRRRRGTVTNRQGNASDIHAYEATLKMQYIEWLSNVMTNLFTYTGLPETINTRWLEQLLFNNGMSSVGLNQLDEWVVMNNALGSGVNGYGDIIGVGGMNDLNDTDNDGLMQNEWGFITRTHPMQGRVIMVQNKNSWNNVPQTDHDLINVYASELANIKALSRANRVMQQMPYIIKAKKGTLTMQNILDMVRDMQPFVEVDATMELKDSLDVLNLSVPNLMTGMKDEWNNVLSEFLTMVGIQNVGTDKRERLTASEAEGNNALTTVSGNVRLESRREFIELFNIHNGTNATVDWNMDLINELQGVSEESTVPDGTAGNEAGDNIQKGVTPVNANMQNNQNARK